MSRTTREYFKMEVDRKYAVPWLQKKGWVYKDKSGMIDPKTGKYVVLEQAIELQMIREA